MTTPDNCDYLCLVNSSDIATVKEHIAALHGWEATVTLSNNRYVPLGFTIPKGTEYTVQSNAIDTIAIYESSDGLSSGSYINLNANSPLTLVALRDVSYILAYAAAPNRLPCELSVSVRAVDPASKAAENSQDWERIDTINLLSPGGYYFKVAAGTEYNGVTYDRDTWIKRESSAAWKPSTIGVNLLKIAQLPTLSGSTSYEFFRDCIALEELKVCRDWDVSGLTHYGGLFSNCQRLRDLDVSKWNTAHNVSLYRTFNSCHCLRSLDLSGWVTTNVTALSQAFYGCWALTSVGDIKDWDTSMVTDMSYCFSACKSLTSIDLSGWDTLRVTSMGNMFAECSSLRYISIGAAFFKTAVAIPFNGAPNLGFDTDDADNGWLQHLVDVTPTIRNKAVYTDLLEQQGGKWYLNDGVGRTLQLPTKLKNASWAAPLLNALTNKGYTVA